MSGTLSAPGTFHRINISGVVDQRDLEISRLTLHAFDFTAHHQIDIYMPADLDQFGRDHSHGTIVGGEGLVQPGHHPTDGR